MKIAVCMLALLFAGCAAPGSFCLARLDLRSPEQIAAARAEKTAMYVCDSTGGVRAAGAFPWEPALKTLPLVHGEIEIGSFRWGRTK